MYGFMSAFGQLNENVENASFKNFVKAIETYDNEIIIDARPQHQKDEFGFQQAVHIPTKENLEKFADTTDLETPILVYCTEGFRSVDACNLLFELGFTTLINLKSGIKNKKREIIKLNKKN